jgi:hypothetical protein
MLKTLLPSAFGGAKMSEYGTGQIYLAAYAGVNRKAIHLQQYLT